MESHAERLFVFVNLSPTHFTSTPGQSRYRNFGGRRVSGDTWLKDSMRAGLPAHELTWLKDFIRGVLPAYEVAWLKDSMKGGLPAHELVWLKDSMRGGLPPN